MKGHDAAGGLSSGRRRRWSRRHRDARRPRNRARPTTETIDASLWQTFRAVVVSPRQAMADLTVDPRAGLKGLQVLVIVEVAYAVVLVAQGQLDPPTPPVWMPAFVTTIVIATGAVILWLASQAHGYASAFGRLSFANQVPSALIGLPVTAIGTILLLLGGTQEAEQFASLSTPMGAVMFIWGLALAFLAIRASVVGWARVGCTALLIVVAFFVATFLAVGVLFVADEMPPFPEVPAE